MPEVSALAKRVKAYRKSIGGNQFERDQHRETQLIERGEANPRLSTMQKIAAHMGISVSALLEVEEE